MNETPQTKPTNKALLLIRRLAADKRETQQQMREEFLTNPDIRQAVAELNRLACKDQQAND